MRSIWRAIAEAFDALTAARVQRAMEKRDMGDDKNAKAAIRAWMRNATRDELLAEKLRWLDHIKAGGGMYEHPAGVHFYQPPSPAVDDVMYTRVAERYGTEGAEWFAGRTTHRPDDGGRSTSDGE